MKSIVNLWLVTLYLSGCSLLPAPAGAEGILFEKESMYHYVMVDEYKNVRRLRFRRKGTDYDESSIDTRDPLRPVSDYVRLFFSAFLFCPDAERVLMIGLGGGCVPRIVHHYFPDVQMDSVELDPVVVEAAEKHFDFKTDAKNRVFVRDGRVQVRLFLREKVRYDIVMLDAFRGGYIPYHLTTKEFMEQCKGLLTERGVVAANMRPDFKIYDYHKRTIAAVFPSLYTFGKVGNKICVAIPAKRQVSDLELKKTALELQARHPVDFRFPTLLEDFNKETDYETAGEVFTDDYAPANVLRGIPRE
jgi:spermidine synthase